MKRCPFCAEEIQDEAIICRFCGRELDPYKVKEVTARYSKPDTSEVIPKTQSSHAISGKTPERNKSDSPPVLYDDDYYQSLPFSYIESFYVNLSDSVKTRLHQIEFKSTAERNKAILDAYARKNVRRDPPKSYSQPSKLQSVLEDDYTKSKYWYPRGGFGSLALIIAFLMGSYGLESGDSSAISASIGFSVLALLLMGGNGILWTLITWAVILGITYLI